MIGFNQKEQEIWRNLREKGKTDNDFPKFVKSLIYEKDDKEDITNISGGENADN